MQVKQNPHIPVMPGEMLKTLEPKDGKSYLDATFGAGGYARAILDSCNCNLIALDQDPNVKIFADEFYKKYKNRFEFIQTNFANASNYLTGKKFDGIVLDLGVSSMQLDIADRGFSFSCDGPLDMRMSGEGESAADFINSAFEEEIADVIYKYGGEHASRKIARAVIYERKINPITTTFRFADIVRKACKVRGKIDSATKTFQAIRIHVNKELVSLEVFLSGLKNIMDDGARAVIVSFHSLEDRIVKNFIKENSGKKRASSKYSVEIKEKNERVWLKALTRKPLIPTINEIRANPRSRSAKLRAIIKEDNI